jgi:hypothetical protein
MTVMTICGAVHEASGSVCTREENHTADSDPRVQQHLASNGVKWPTLHELDPHEGYNDAVLHRM